MKTSSSILQEFLWKSFICLFFMEVLFFPSCILIFCLILLLLFCSNTTTTCLCAHYNCFNNICYDVYEWFEILIIGDEITLNMQILKILLKINLNDSLGGNLWEFLKEVLKINFLKSTKTIWYETSKTKNKILRKYKD